MTLTTTSSAGFYEPFRRNLNKVIRRPVNEQIPLTSIIAGASSGAVGGMTINYFSLSLNSIHSVVG
jgi:hypothetical protein